MLLNYNQKVGLILKKISIFIAFLYFVVSLSAQETDTQKVFRLLDLDTNGYIPKALSSQFCEKRKESRSVKNFSFQEKKNLADALYLKSNIAYDVENSDPAYDIRLELDLYNQGYYQQQKNLKKRGLEKKILFYKTLQGIEVLQKKYEFAKIQKYQNSLSVSDLLLELKFYELCYNNAYRRLKAGLITKNDFELYKMNLQNVKDKLVYFQYKTLLKIPMNVVLFLNNIENIKLVKREKLFELLHEKSMHPKIMNALAEKEKLDESWEDRLRLNLYVGKRKMYLSQEQVLVGIEAKIPLIGNRREKEYKSIEIANLKEEKNLQEFQDRESLQDAIARFVYEQHKIRTMMYGLRRVKKDIKDLSRVLKSPYGIYVQESYASKEKLIASYLTKYTLLQKERIIAYKELINILYSVHETSLESIVNR